ncbi:MAG TPA: biopolymer transporter ExbD [Thermoanaerobaculia bacterium]|nr:biopolymer transporter ExbD [Thermoanaerobaculia bacterium]
MGMGGAGARDKLQSEINVTPLVDVCLVLLIIFMVVTPLLQKGIAVSLPATDKPDKKPENANQKVVTIGYATPPVIYLEADRLSKDEFSRRLDEMYQRSPQTELVIKADKRLKYGDVKDIMKVAKDAGFQNIGLIAEKKTQGVGAAPK